MICGGQGRAPAEVTEFALIAAACGGGLLLILVCDALLKALGL